MTASFLLDSPAQVSTVRTAGYGSTLQICVKFVCHLKRWWVRLALLFSKHAKLPKSKTPTLMSNPVHAWSG